MRRVDLPTPGSPPIRTRLPATIPPPRTRLSSPHSRRVRGASSGARSVRATALAGCSGRGLASLDAFRTWNSWSVFHAWQWGHWPAHRRLSPPHSVQTKVMVDLGMRRLCTHDRGFTSPAVSLYRGQAFYLVSVTTPS